MKEEENKGFGIGEPFKKGDILMSRDGQCVFKYDRTITTHSNPDGYYESIYGTEGYDMNKETYWGDDMAFFSKDVIVATSEIILKYEERIKKELEKRENLLKNSIKALDFVKERGGNINIGLVTATAGLGGACSVSWLMAGTGLKAAWWEQNELIKINSLPSLLTKKMAP